jgi:hypothetical protein
MEASMIELSARTIQYEVRTRAQRRAAIASIAKQLKRVRDAEMESICNIPGNFANNYSCFLGEAAIETIDRAIEYISVAYNEEKSRKMNQLCDDVPF